MIDPNKFKHFADLDTHQLEEIIKHHEKYELGAVDAAIQELNTRGVELQTAEVASANHKSPRKTSSDIFTTWIRKVKENYLSIDKKARTLVIVISIVSLFFYLHFVLNAYKKPILLFLRMVNTERLHIYLVYDVFCMLIFPVGLFYFLQGKKTGWLILMFFWIQRIANPIREIVYQDLRLLEVMIVILIIYVLLIIWHSLIVVGLLITRIRKAYAINNTVALFAIIISILLFLAVHSF